MTSPLLEKFIKLYGYRPTEFDKRYLELLEMGRYRVLAVPDVSPGTCCNCGASKEDGRKYIDTGRHVEWFGAIFFCSLCLREYAQAMGLFDVVKEELEEVKALVMSQEALKGLGDRLHTTIVQTYDEFRAYYDSLHSVSNELSTDSGTDVESNKTASDEPTAPETKSRVTKSTSGSGRKDIPSFTELLKS